MSKIQVSNIKCGGCINSITKAMEKNGFKNIQINIENQTVYFDGEIEKAEKVLTKIGYPKAGTEEVKKLTNKAKSYISCIIGKINK